MRRLRLSNTVLMFVGTLSALGIVLLTVVMGNGAKDPKTDIVSGQQIDPCGHLYSGREDVGNTGRARSLTIEDWTGYADTVARILVTDILEPRFETINGQVPTPLSTTSTDEDEDDYEDRILSPVVFDAQEIFKGDTVDGFVVAKWGGQVAQCVNYTYKLVPNPLDCQEAESGVLFLSEPSEHVMSAQPPWYLHLIATADALNVSGGNYKVMILDNFFRYQDANALNIYRDPMTIVDLEQEIEDAINP